MEKISIFIADWQVLFREGIHFTLCGEDDMDVIGEATSGEEALNFIETNPPRIAILNMNGGKLGGVEATHRIKRNFPSVPVVLVTDIDDEEHLFAALKCGASAYITKNSITDLFFHLGNILVPQNKRKSVLSRLR